MPETSIIIRTKNEERWVGECLKRLQKQIYKNFEIIIVDSGSIDRTLKIVKKFPVKLFQIKPEEFSYPYALNYGCKQAAATRYFVLLSAHSLPISETWLEDGISNFTDDKIMGVYGFVRPLSDASIWEKLFFNKYLGLIRRIFKRGHSGVLVDFFKGKVVVKKYGMGVLGFTNAVIKKDLWAAHNFDESYGLGGEDGEWARYWLGRGYKIIRDRNFSVLHSHGLNLGQLREQFRHWASLGEPQPFKPLNFRKKA